MATDEDYYVKFHQRRFDSRDIISVKREKDTTEGVDADMEEMTIHAIAHGKVEKITSRGKGSLIGSFIYELNSKSKNTALPARPLFVRVNTSALYNAHHIDNVYHDEEAGKAVFTLRGGMEEEQACKPEDFQKLREMMEAYDQDTGIKNWDDIKEILPENAASRQSRFPKVASRSVRARDDVFELDGDGGAGHEARVGSMSRLLGGDDNDGKALLHQYGTNLIAEAKAGRYNDLVPRQTDIDSVCEILNMHTVKSVVLRGETGVGKKSTVQALAKAIFDGDPKIPLGLRKSQIWTLDITAMGSKWVSEHETKVKAVIDYVTAQNKKGQRIILHIEGLHAQLQAGAATNTPPIGESLNRYLSNGYVQIIGTTTRDKYDEYMLNNPDSKNRYSPVDIEPPSQEDLIKILQRNATRITVATGVTVPLPEIMRCIEMTNRFIHDEPQPSKAVNMLARACSLADRLGTKTLTADHLAEAVGKETGLQTGFILKGDKKRILEIREELPRQVIGQDQATKPIASHLVGAFGELQPRRGPLGKFLLVGPTGVGKTQTGRTLATILSGDEKELIRLDMADYKTLNDLDKLVDELTRRVRQNPFSVIMLDEIEKSGREVRERLLAMLEEGELKDSQGRKVSFKNTIVLMSSNVGADQFADSAFGFGQDSGMNAEASREHYRQAVINEFAPEFIGRLDGVAYYNQLEHAHIRQLINREIAVISAKAKEKYGVDIAIEDSVYDQLIEASNFKQYGARDMSKTIGSKIVEPLTIELFAQEDELKQQLTGAAASGRASPVILVKNIGDDYAQELVFDRPELLPVKMPVKTDLKIGIT